MTTVTIDHLTPLQKTLLITLNGRVLDANRKRPLLDDAKAVELARGIDYDHSTVRLGAGVPEAVAIRSRMLDRAVTAFVHRHRDAVVVELGCGLETRHWRLTASEPEPWRDVDWYDVDFPEVIALRETLMDEADRGHSVGVSLLDSTWTDTIPGDRPAVILSDGVLGFLSEDDNRRVLRRITDHFATGELVFNAYTRLTARMNGRFTQVVGMPHDFRGYGISDPEDVTALNPALTFIDEQFGDAAPERDKLNLAYRLLARLFAGWRGQARRGVWVVRYRF
ncbi:O-methyltransferase involved in polyketide biosynthesis [Stackebrandtia albiflava]|uniref:O-methyltransferase involved in polyketide biosynthesis n=1 Tax=Stackebrandtia albiflava TaxID=406432 RepID=A0A562V493_9ACTN|nr:class I SAM-dependent methyltransferase [Stackebrandtia albiflava]TWJ12693.1 O-methyltransferase involved in polyketide biosynthesis [Stackebrandtia albiflava]